MRILEHQGRPWAVELGRLEGPISVYREILHRSTNTTSPDDELWFFVCRPHKRIYDRIIIEGHAVVLLDEEGPYLNDIEANLEEDQASLLAWLFDQISLSRENLLGRAWARKTRSRAVDQVTHPPWRSPDAILGGDQLEVFRLLGELHPYLWPAQKFLAWAQESNS